MSENLTKNQKTQITSLKQLFKKQYHTDESNAISGQDWVAK